ncbi:RNA polymerase subunit sigma-24 [Clostridium sp. CF011]|uniref:RNA polymerase subunit sigma-24 n=1 Tax=Clostridium sp. CF011 TaxID=2843318 RepID=UPI001C0D6DE0|nr:RNA polymerase subunit sigma-24 [Clostridium sp. CF011]MBU3093541.1 RNA polymerase subunit sigma-24 [Clostridium sp. CF011]WAG71723.1 RNA polymerase subunit sigma-24 [Clostridium sp. CF011]
MAGRKVTFDTDKAIELLNKGFKQKDIAKELNIKESTLKMFYKRKAAGELKKVKEQKKIKISDGELEHSHFLSIDDLKEIREEKSYGILPHESIGDYGFLKVNIQSYKLSKNSKKLIFDETRGLRTYAVPKSY